MPSKTMLPCRITAEWLESIDAFHEDIANFSGEWPNGCEWTAENVRRATAIKIDLCLIAESVLSTAQWDTFNAMTEHPWNAVYEAMHFAWLTGNKSIPDKADRDYRAAVAEALIRILNLE